MAARTSSGPRYVTIDTPLTEEERALRRQRLLELLESYQHDDDDQEQCDALALLKHALDEDRPDDAKLFEPE